MKKHTIRPILGGTLALLAQCSPLRDRTFVPASSDVSWQAAAQLPARNTESSLSRWWEHFGDARLNRMILEGFNANPDLAAAWQNVAESAALRRASEASLFPRLDATAGADRSVIRRDAGADSQGTTYTGRIEASWEADWFGKNRSLVAAASADTAAAAELWHAAKVSLSSDIALAWWTFWVHEARKSVLQRIIATRQEASELANWRRQAGQADALESAQATASLEQARSGLASLSQSSAASRHLLAKLTGKPPTAAIPAPSGSSLPTPPASLAVRIPADLIRQRPDLREATWRWVAAAARSQSARAEALPTLRLTGTLGTSALGSGKLFSPDQVAGDLIAGLAGPIFDAGRIRAQIAANDAATRRELERYRATLLNALSEVEDASAACKHTRLKIASLETSAKAAREAAELAMQRYRAGVTDLTAVLDTQRVLLESEDALISTQGDLLNAHVRLFKAVGGGW